MNRNFSDPRELYARLRRAFVYKEKPSRTPLHLARHRAQPQCPEPSRPARHLAQAGAGVLCRTDCGSRHSGCGGSSCRKAITAAPAATVHRRAAPEMMTGPRLAKLGLRLPVRYLNSLGHCRTHRLARPGRPDRDPDPGREHRARFPDMIDRMTRGGQQAPHRPARTVEPVPVRDEEVLFRRTGRGSGRSGFGQAARGQRRRGPAAGRHKLRDVSAEAPCAEFHKPLPRKLCRPGVQHLRCYWFATGGQSGRHALNAARVPGCSRAGPNPGH